MIFWRMSFREMQNRPVRTLLTLLSVILGSAAVVSVSLTTATIHTAQTAMFTTLTGRTDLEIIAEGGASFDQELYGTVKAIPGVRVVAPSVYRSTVLYAGERKAKTQIMGVDPRVDSDFRSYNIVDGAMPKSGSELAMDDRLARSLGIKAGDTVRLLTRSGMKEWKVIGLLRPQGGAALAQGGILFAPIRTVQTQFRSGKKLDKMEVLVTDVKQRASIHEAVQKALPTGLLVKEPAQDNQVANQAINATELGLTLATTFALMIAIFIIFNTFQMVVGERRRQLGVLRAIGTTRKQITRFVLNEAILLGTVGTLLGSVLGVFGAFILTRATSQVLQSDMPDPQLQPLPFVISAVFGIGIAWLGAYMPARRAGMLPPSEAMQTSISSEISGSSYGWRIFGGVLSVLGIAMHLGCILGWLSMKWSIPGSTLFLFGMVFVIPMLFPPMSVVVQWMLAPFMGVESKLAYRQLMRHRSRTALTTSVLFIAISSGLGLGCTIMDNIRDVDVWCSQAIVGDFFVRAAMPDLSTGRSADLPDEVGDDLKKVPGIRELEPLRFVNARSGDNSLIVIIRSFRNAHHINFDILDGTERTILDGFNNDQIVIGSVLAERTKLKQGDKIPMQTLQGTIDFTIAGIVNDYIAGGLTIYMDRKLAEQVFEVQGQDAYIIQAEQGKLAEVEKAVSKICDEQGLLFQSNADLVEMIRAMSRGVNASLWGLLALGSAIASFGLINTLSMNIIEQTREIGLLRVVAMTRKQIRRMIFAQALLLGIVGFVPGACMGFVVAYLINLSTYTATGHVIEFVFRPWLAIAAVAVSLAMALAASLVPAERAARISLPSALRYE